jgi:hypothetical protein
MFFIKGRIEKKPEIFGYNAKFIKDSTNKIINNNH